MKAIIFVPGYKGSILKNEETGESVWMPISLLFRNKGSLALPVAKGDIRPSLIAAGILRLPPLVPDIYGPILERLAGLNNNNTKVFHFSYDWRQSILTSAAALKKLVENLRKTGYREINFVSHSMGGIVLAYYLRYGDQGPEQIEREWVEAKGVKNAVFCASPFQGTARALVYTLSGNRQLFNNSILSSRVSLSFPVAYEMMPTYTRSVLNPIDHNDSIDVFSVESWQRHQIGLFGYPELPKNEVYTFLDKTLNTARGVLKLLNRGKSEMRILSIISNDYPTLRETYIDLKNSNRLIYELKQLRKIERARENAICSGDGLVCEESGRHPFSFSDRCTERVLSFNHKTVFQKKKVNDLILDFVTS